MAKKHKKTKHKQPKQTNVPSDITSDKPTTPINIDKKPNSQQSIKPLVIDYTKMRVNVYTTPTQSNTEASISDDKQSNNKQDNSEQETNKLATSAKASQTTFHQTKNTANKNNNPQSAQPIIEPKYVKTRTDNKENTKQLSAWQISIVLFSSILLVSWLKSEQLASYWQQSYQQSQPWANLEKIPTWQQGAAIAKALDAQPSIDVLGKWGSQSTQMLNQKLYANEILHREQLRQTQIKQQEAMRLARENTQKATEVATPKKLTHVQINRNQKVFFAGDSMMQGVAPWVMRRLQNDHQIQSIDLSKQSTGLSYSSFFDWPATIETTIQNDDGIGLLIVFLGANDPWAVPDPKSRSAPYIDFATPDWNTLYHQKIHRILDIAYAHNVQVIWLTPPTMKKPKLNNQMAQLSQIMHDGIDDTKVLLLDAKPLLSTSDDYQDSIIIDGKKTKVRTADGIHFTPDGQKHIANFLLNHIQIRP